MAQITTVDDVLEPGSKARPVAPIMAVMSVASAVAAWVAFVGSPPTILEAPKDQLPVFDTRFQSYDDDLRTELAEVNNKAGTLAAEAPGILSDWRARPVLQSPRATPTAPPSPSPMVLDQSSTSVLDSSTSPEIDLLKIENAIDAQKHLHLLGYFGGPTNGVWGPQSRNSLRLFKVANDLANDDAFDVGTASRLYSSLATRKPNSIKLQSQSKAFSATLYSPPSGATLNPLNQLDAIEIHRKLRELGFYRANSNRLWSVASRNALRDFKTANDMNSDDLWDAATERRLMSARPGRTTDEINAGFVAATSGIWSIDPRACPTGVGGSDALVLTITSKRAETEGARCEFGFVSGLGTTWKAVGMCTVNDVMKKSNITFVRTGDVLDWSSENGATKYLRCAN